MAEFMKPDIIFFTETKIDSDINSCEFLPEAYSSAIRKDRNKDGGGVLIATRKDLGFVEIDLCENSAEFVWAKIIVCGQEPILAGCFYRTNREHTTAQIEVPEKTLTHVQDNHNPNGKYTVLLGGDFNVTYINWETFTISSECNIRKMYDKLLDIIDKNGMQQLQHQPTCCGSVWDLFFTSKPSLIKDITVIPGISDHDAVVVDTVIMIKPNRKLPRRIRQWYKTDWDEVREDVTQYRDSYFHKASSQPVEENYKSFQDFIKDIIDTYVPSKMSSVRWNVPWCTPAIKGMCQKKQRLYNKYRKSHRSATGKPSKSTKEPQLLHWDRQSGNTLQVCSMTAWSQETTNRFGDA